MNKALPYWVIWLVFGLIGAAVAMLYSSAAFVDGQYIPVGNDSFYHARRIIDAAISERGFYQFDTMIHVPEGSWLNWPWAYDYPIPPANAGRARIACPRRVQEPSSQHRTCRGRSA